jgi:hypothetical protein
VAVAQIHPQEIRILHIVECRSSTHWTATIESSTRGTLAGFPVDAPLPDSRQWDSSQTGDLTVVHPPPDEAVDLFVLVQRTRRVQRNAR